jgi:hypothetical protein
MFKPADYGGVPDDFVGGGQYGLFNRVELEWTRPIVWSRGDDLAVPSRLAGEPGLYMGLANHPRQKDRDRIFYVGLARDLPKRLTRQHPIYKNYVDKRSSSKISVSMATPRWLNIRVKDDELESVLRHLEHLLIWAVWPYLDNKQNMERIPGTSGALTKRNLPWIITNAGPYRFRGRLPRQIVFPWMLIEPGRDRSAKAAKSRDRNQQGISELVDHPALSPDQQTPPPAGNSETRTAADA